MSTQPTSVDKKPAPSKDRPGNGTKPKPAGPPIAGSAASKDAKRLAVVILEVLGGQRTPTDAAAALTVSLPRYYFLEQRALEGLVKGCEPRNKGRTLSPERRLAELQREVARLQRESARQQALIRVSQRTVGLGPPPAAPAKGMGKGAANRKRRKRKPVARALKAAAVLEETLADAETSFPVASAVPETVTAV